MKKWPWGPTGEMDAREGESAVKRLSPAPSFGVSSRDSTGHLSEGAAAARTPKRAEDERVSRINQLQQHRRTQQDARQKCRHAYCRIAPALTCVLHQQLYDFCPINNLQRCMTMTTLSSLVKPLTTCV